MAVVAGSLFLAGCLDEPAPEPECRYSAAEPRVAGGYAYDAGNLAPANGTLIIDIDEEANTGTVSLNASANGVLYAMDWTTFAQANGSDFQDGGVVRGIHEHGDSGVGDTNIPKVFMDCAGWGTTALQVDGEPFFDGYTGGAPFSAHFMVLSEGIRDDSGKITKADGTTPYDPGAPSDARTIPEDQEVILILKSSPGATPAEKMPYSVGETANGAYTKAWPFEVVQGSTVYVNASLAPAGPAPTGQLQFRVLSDTGNVQGQPVQLGITSGQASGSIVVQGVPAGAEWSLSVTGQAAALDYAATIEVVPPGPTFLLFHFESVTAVG